MKIIKHFMFWIGQVDRYERIIGLKRREILLLKYKINEINNSHESNSRLLEKIRTIEEENTKLKLIIRSIAQDESTAALIEKAKSVYGDGK